MIIIKTLMFSFISHDYLSLNHVLIFFFFFFFFFDGIGISIKNPIPLPSSFSIKHTDFYGINFEYSLSISSVSLIKERIINIIISLIYIYCMLNFINN